MGDTGETAKTDPLGLVGVTLKGTYRVDAFAKRGGFGAVYKATHLSLRKPVALKVFCLLTTPGAQIAAEALQLFYQEVEILSRLEHPATVKPYDCGRVAIDRYGEVPWMALEWLEGRTLSEILRDGGGARWKPGDALDLLRPVIEALAEAHANGIGHRDVAPNNIFVCETPQGRRVRLIDFGIACIKAPVEGPNPAVDSPSLSELVAHSPRYPAPEQVTHQRTGPWTDVHALGLILHQLLTGEMPYPEGILDLERGACAERRPTPGLVGLDVGAWEPVLARAVSLDAKLRYERADALLADLGASVDRAGAPDPGDGSGVAAGWRVFDLPETAGSFVLNTPERTFVVHAVAPTPDALRRGVVLPFDEGLLPCALTLERYAGETLALTAVSRAQGREGLYSSTQTERLTRAMVFASKTLHCGHRTSGFARIVCHSVKAADVPGALRVDLPAVNLRVRTGSPARELVVLEVADEARATHHLVCVTGR